MRTINQRRSKREGGKDPPSVGTIVGDIEEKKIERRTVFFLLFVALLLRCLLPLVRGGGKELLNYEKSNE